jgi:hypothetical protein
LADAEAEDCVTGSTARFSVASAAVFAWACVSDWPLAAVGLLAFACVGLRARAGAATDPRAAARRALERCGRVRGRLASTPSSLRGVFVALELTSASGMCTSLLKAAAETLPGACKLSARPLRSTRVTR